MNLFNDLSSCINPKLKEVITATSHQYLKEEENKMNEFIKKMLELGAEFSQSCSEIERAIIINDAQLLYINHIKKIKEELK